MDIFRWNDKPINSSAKTYIVIHGYQSNGREDWVTEIESNLAKKDPSANILALNWKDEAGGLIYGTAANNAEGVGKQLAHYLKDQGINPANVEVIGHSLGAHVAAYASEEFYKITQQGYFLKKQVLRGFGHKTWVQEKCSEQGFDKIVGLDPAGVAVGTNLDESPLFHRRSHAKKVVAIHTSYTWGTEKNVGDLDLHLNRNDIWQPDKVGNPTGNHSYAHEWYLELLKGEIFKQIHGPTVDMNTLSNATGEMNITTREGRDSSFLDKVAKIFGDVRGPGSYYLMSHADSSDHYSAEKFLNSSDLSEMRKPFMTQGNENAPIKLNSSDPIDNHSYSDKLDKASLQGKNTEWVYASSLNLDTLDNQKGAVDLITANDENYTIPYAEMLQDSDIFGADTMVSNSGLNQNLSYTFLSSNGGVDLPLGPVCEVPPSPRTSFIPQDSGQNYDPFVGQGNGSNFPIPSTEVFQDSDIFGADTMVGYSNLNQNPSNAFSSNNFGGIVVNFPPVVCPLGFEPITMGSLSQSNGSSVDLNTLGSVQSFNDIVSTQTGLNFTHTEQHAFV